MFSRRVQRQLCEFAEILDRRCHDELVFGAVRASETQAVEPQDSFDMGEQHFHLLSGIAGCHIGVGLVMSRAMLRAPSSWIDRRILRAGTFGQQRCFSGQASQSFLLAR